MEYFTKQTAKFMTHVFGNFPEDVRAMDEARAYLKKTGGKGKKTNECSAQRSFFGQIIISEDVSLREFHKNYQKVHSVIPDNLSLCSLSNRFQKF